MEGTTTAIIVLPPPIKSQGAQTIRLQDQLNHRFYIPIKSQGTQTQGLAGWHPKGFTSLSNYKILKQFQKTEKGLTVLHPYQITRYSNLFSCLHLIHMVLLPYQITRYSNTRQDMVLSSGFFIPIKSQGTQTCFPAFT